jgi:isoleucyl-tRNA synthetase
VGHGALEEIVRKVLLTYWNTASFFTLYANAEEWSPADLASAPPAAERPLLDRWALAELHRTVAEVTAALDVYDTQRAGRRLADFLDDLSNWYVRRSRRRFWQGSREAFATLYECLETVTRLMSPLTPFVTDYLWDVLRAEDQPSSVHLTSWPAVREELLNPALSEQMALVRRLVELGRSARASSGVKTRQPLRRALVGAHGWPALPGELRGLVADELNVQALEDMSGFSADLVSYTVKPNFRALGKRFGSRTKLVAAAVGAADAASVARTLRSGATVTLAAGELGEVTLGPDEVIVTEQPRSGWAVETGAFDTGTGETVALDLELTDELRRAGLLREVIRLVQEARKATGLSITDRISLWWRSSDPDLAEALRAGAQVVADEVLATSVTEGDEPGLPEHTDADLGLTFQLRRA